MKVIFILAMFFLGRFVGSSEPANYEKVKAESSVACPAK